LWNAPSPGHSPPEVETEVPKDQFTTEPWALHVNKTSNMNKNEAGLVLNSLGGQTFNYTIYLEFPSSSNIIKYKAFLVGFCLAESLNANPLMIFSDSQLVAGQC
jgi:ribonuclease HI